MLASMAFLLAVAVGVGLIVLATVGRARGTEPELGSWVMALGSLAAVAFVATGLIQRLPTLAWNACLVGDVLGLGIGG